MPVLILAIAEDFDKLLQDCCLATITFLRKLGRVMVMTVDAAFMLVVRVLRTENSWADATREVLDMVLAI